MGSVAIGVGKEQPPFAVKRGVRGVESNLLWKDVPKCPGLQEPIHRATSEWYRSMPDMSLSQFGRAYRCADLSADS